MKINNIILVFFFFLGTVTAQDDCSSFPNGVQMIPGDVQLDTVVPPNNPPPPTTVISNDRIIFFVHGLGGTTNTWTRASYATESGALNHPDFLPRKANALRPTYPEFTLTGAGSDLHDALIISGDPINAANGITDPTVNYIIASSQGGLVARSADMLLDQGEILEDRRFGGIVTFGTSHEGAKIIENIPLISQFAAEGCDALIAGPAQEKIADLDGFGGMAIRWFLSADKINEIVNGVCNFVGDVIVPIAFEDYTSPITQDYIPGAQPLIELNNHQSSTQHKVAFYGVEEDPVFWRLMNSLIIEEPNLVGFFEAGDDEEGKEIGDEYQLNWRAKGDEWFINTFLLERSSVGLIQRLFAKKRIKHARATMDAYYRGWQFFLNADDKYKAIIGALEVTEGQDCYCREVMYDYADVTYGPWKFEHTITPADPVCEDIENPYPELDYTECEARPNGNIRRVVKQSDGVVLAESAMGFPGAVIDKLDKSNHQQMRNDENTKRVLKNLYDGGYGNYFYVEPK